MAIEVRLLEVRFDSTTNRYRSEVRYSYVVTSPIPTTIPSSQDFKDTDIPKRDPNNYWALSTDPASLAGTSEVEIHGNGSVKRIHVKN